MASIKTFKLPPSSFENILVSRNNHLNHILNISANTFEYKLTRTKSGDEEEDVIVYDMKLDLATLKAHNRFCDHSYWVVKGNIFPVENYQENIIKNQLLSVFEKTFATKQQPLINHTIDVDYLSPIRIFVPSEESTFNECTFLVLHPMDDNPPVGQTIDNPWNITISVDKNSPHTYSGDMPSASDLLGNITASTNLTTVQPGTPIPVTVTCSDTSVTKLYLQQVVGLLDRYEVDMTNGSGTFNVITDTLTSGDNVKVKIGYKKFSNVEMFTKTLA